MLVFNNQQRSGYEEISSYSPLYYKYIREMDAIFRLAGWLTDLMASGMESMMSNQFFILMDDEALARYEAFLGISTDKSKTLDERKSYIMALLIGSGKLSKDKIIAIVNQFVECDCDVFLEDSVLHINMTFDGDLAKYMSSIRKLLWKLIPAHIGLLYSGLTNISVTWRNQINVQRIINRMMFRLYTSEEPIYLDGSRYLDGSMRLNKSLCLFPVKIGNRFSVHNKESTKEYLTVKHNLYYTDGSVLLDGSRTLDAYIIEEEL